MDETTKELTDGEKLNLLLKTIDALGERMAALEQNQIELKQNQEALEQNQILSNSRLAALEQRIEERWYDTRPNWNWLVKEVEQIRAEVAQIRAHQQRHDEQFEQALQRLTQIESLLEVLNQDQLYVKGRQRTLENRVSLLEQKTAA